MATISFVNVGTFISGIGTLTTTVPAGLRVNDLLLLLVFSGQQTITTPTSVGGTWTQIGDQTIQNGGTAGTNNGAARLAVYYKFARQGEPSATVNDSGNINVAQMAAYRNVDLKRPFFATASAGVGTATTAITMPAVTTTIPNCEILFCIGNGTDANSTAQLSNPVNTNLTNITERIDRVVNTSTGGGLGLIGATSPNAKNIGTTSITNATSTVYGLLTLALRPRRRIAAYS